MSTAPNRNIFWAKTFVDELARCGLEAVCIAPGSRSTPLVIAFAENPHIKVYSHIDERSAAFFALGMALATDKPVAILCSSGTATANFHPAVIEARYANVPLLVLTADRSHEMRDSGANQTIDQVKMFGTHVLWAYDVALPEANPPAVAVRNLRTLADRAYAKANGVMGLEKGPVHLNFPFRKPLDPTLVEGEQVEIAQVDDNRPMTTFWHPVNAVPFFQDSQSAEIYSLIHDYRRGIIICGPRCPGDVFDARVTSFSHGTGYPIFADPLSGLRFNSNAEIASFGGYDTFLTQGQSFEDPDVVIHFGAMPASGTLEQYLNRINPKHRILFAPNGNWTDAVHRLTEVITADPIRFMEFYTSHKGEDKDWCSQIRAVENSTWEVLNIELDKELFDGSAVAVTVNQLPDQTSLFVASSLAVRHLEQYAAPRSVNIHVYANRGASGIDGTISSALGVAASDPEKPTLLITGDLAFYHDMNGLLAVKRCDIKNIVIVLINNDGGGIFQRLPIRDFDPPFTDLFLTPHGLDFEPAVRMYGLDYHRAETLDSLRDLVKNSVGSNVPTVIEVRTNYKRDYERREEINKLVQDRLKELFKS